MLMNGLISITVSLSESVFYTTLATFKAIQSLKIGKSVEVHAE